MTRRSRPDAAPDDPWPVALRILARRDYSRAELHQRLTDKGFATEPIAEALARCAELGYLDDRRYAFARAAGLMRQGRAVGHRILADLRQRGISRELAEEALAAARDACCEDAVLATLVERRFPGFRYAAADARERRRVIQFLQRRGFAIGRIMDYMTRKGSATDDEDR